MGKQCLLLGLKPALGMPVLAAGGPECAPGSTLGQFVGEQMCKDRIYDHFCSVFPARRLQSFQLVRCSIFCFSIFTYWAAPPVGRGRTLGWPKGN